MSFIIIGGRQHSGNTMLTRVIGDILKLQCYTNEATFFENMSHSLKYSYEEFISFMKTACNKNEVVHLPNEKKYTNVKFDEWLNRFQLNSYKYAFVCKGTSAIFYTKFIFHNNKNKFIYLKRNPYNIFFSMKKRSEGRVPLLSFIIALRKADKNLRDAIINNPKQIKIINYEDLILNTDSCFKEILNFLQVKYNYKPKPLPVINTRDAPYQESNMKKNLTYKTKYIKGSLNEIEEFLITKFAKVQPRYLIKVSEAPNTFKLLIFLFFDLVLSINLRSIKQYLLK